jgi:ribosome maturation factor RimP
MSIKNDIYNLLEPLTKSLGYDLWNCEIVGGGRHTILRVLLEKDGGLTIDDCTYVSRKVSALLDVENPFRSNYTLEVSSPGVERSLVKSDHYKKYIGKKINVQLYEQINNCRKFSCVIQNVEDDSVSLLMDSKETIHLNFSAIEKANVLLEFCK